MFVKVDSRGRISIKKLYDTVPAYFWVDKSLDKLILKPADEEFIDPFTEDDKEKLKIFIDELLKQAIFKQENHGK